MWKEFKDFASKGSLIEIAVAFVMGAAFGRVATTFTEGMVAPLVGQLMGGVDLSKMKAVITPAVPEIKDASGAVLQAGVAEVAIQYGAFLTAVIDFLIVAFVMFLIVKSVNAMKKKEEAAAPAPPPADVTLLTEIRDLLKNR